MGKSALLTTSEAKDTVGNHLSKNIPVCTEELTLEKLIQEVTEKNWDQIDYVFVLDENRKLKGVIHMFASLHLKNGTLAKDVMIKNPPTLKVTDQTTKAVYFVLQHDIDIIPVVDENETFMGVISAKTAIDIMHSEHVENALMVSGVQKGSSLLKNLQKSRYNLYTSLKTRTPWLLVGVAGGLGLSLISSFFEEELRKTVELAFFVPVIAYIADSVGTQSEAIAVRSLATLKINSLLYLLRETVSGILLGAMLGIMGAGGAILITKSQTIAAVVGLSLFTASGIAATLGSLIPMVFKKLGKDPALGSGPLATAIQDLLSVLIYFVFAAIIL